LSGISGLLVIRNEMEREIIFFKRHLCPEWDDLEIGPGDVEWETCCPCKYKEEPEDFEPDKSYDN